jgi:hypothetical protein
MYLGAGPRDTVCNCNLAVGDVEGGGEKRTTRPRRRPEEFLKLVGKVRLGRHATRLDSAGRWIII